MTSPAQTLLCPVFSNTRSSRLFEVIYLCWWFLGANGVKPLDFMQASQNSFQTILMFGYQILAGVFLLVGLAGLLWD